MTPEEKDRERATQIADTYFPLLSKHLRQTRIDAIAQALHTARREALQEALEVIEPFVDKLIPNSTDWKRARTLRDKIVKELEGK